MYDGYCVSGEYYASLYSFHPQRTPAFLVFAFPGPGGSGRLHSLCSHNRHRQRRLLKQRESVPDDRYALSQSASGGGNTISVGAGTYTTSAELNITKDITISGAGAASTIVQAAASAGIADHRLFKDSGVTVTLQNMTIRYGVEASGGGINNASGTLTLNNVIISDNQVKDTTGNGLNGGGISTNGGSVTINNSAIINNSVTTSDVLTSRGNGGGIFIAPAQST
jgi:hypothetical protein